MIQAVALIIKDYDENSPLIAEHADGFQIKSMQSWQLKTIMEFMQVCHNKGICSTAPPSLDESDIITYIADSVPFPNDLVKLMQLFAQSILLNIPLLQRFIIEKICNNVQFIQFTNIRRYIIKYLDHVNPDLIFLVLRKVPADILVFMISDPMLADSMPPPEQIKLILLNHYRTFLKELEAKKQQN